MTEKSIPGTGSAEAQRRLEPLPQARGELVEDAAAARVAHHGVLVFLQEGPHLLHYYLWVCDLRLRVGQHLWMMLLLLLFLMLMLLLLLLFLMMMLLLLFLVMLLLFLMLLLLLFLLVAKVLFLLALLPLLFLLPFRVPRRRR